MTILFKESDSVYTAKRFIMIRDKFTSQKCGMVFDNKGKGSNIDHVIPRSLLAISKVWNLELLCATCNFIKGSQITPDCINHCKDIYKRTYVTKDWLTIKGGEYLNNLLQDRLISEIPVFEIALSNYYEDYSINANNYNFPTKQIIDKIEHEVIGLTALIKDIEKQAYELKMLTDEMNDYLSANRTGTENT